MKTEAIYALNTRRPSRKHEDLYGKNAIYDFGDKQAKRLGHPIKKGMSLVVISYLDNQIYMPLADRKVQVMEFRITKLKDDVTPDTVYPESVTVVFGKLVKKKLWTRPKFVKKFPFLMNVNGDFKRKALQMQK